MWPCKGWDTWRQNIGSAGMHGRTAALCLAGLAAHEDQESHEEKMTKLELVDAQGQEEAEHASPKWRWTYGKKSLDP